MKTCSRMIPRGVLVEAQDRIRQYQELRRRCLRLLAIHQQMLQVLDEMEVMRQEELPWTKN